jgi:predicted RNA binding protein YcfA (HicA-like mRNA interferase family)
MPTILSFARILKGAPVGNTNATGHHKSITGKEAIKRLIKEGWEVSRVKGSHHIMKKPGHLSVPVPMHGKDLGVGLLHAISKQTGVVF